MTPTREQVIEWAEEAGAIQLHEEGWGPVIQGSVGDMQRFAVLAMERAHAAGRGQGLREAKEALSVSEHMHARNGGLMLCISDLSAVIVRMAAGIDHLSETARRWEPDHSSGADRRGWVLATEARDHALRLLKEHASAIEQLRGK